MRAHAHFNYSARAKTGKASVPRLTTSLRKPRRAIPYCFSSFSPELPFFLPAILLFCYTAVLLYCHTAILPYCLWRLRMRSIHYYTIDSTMANSREDLIKLYFYEGYQYRAIVCFLYFVHGIRLSLRQLKRKLQAMNLRHRYQPSHVNIRTVVSIVAVRIPLRRYLLYNCPTQRYIYMPTRRIAN